VLVKYHMHLNPDAAGTAGRSPALGGIVGDCVITVDLVQQSGSQRAQVAIGAVVIAGWTGRDAAAVEEHIAELEQLGVRRPASIRCSTRSQALE